MGELLRHRGPDGEGLVRRPAAVVGARRLRIVDRSPAGDQPFCDPAGRVWLACNGEIYNHRKLRGLYPRYPFRSGSDVEVILPLFLSKGIAGLARLEGMFALAIWDERQRQLILARDRAGEKPLFYFRTGSQVVFASEVQALLAHPAVPRDIDDVAMREYLTLGYVPEPRTMFAGIRKVEAATIHVFSAGDHRMFQYWRPPNGQSASISVDSARGELGSLLQRAVAMQVRAEVPVGVFCSGGVDSSLISALAARSMGAGNLRLFTVGFPDRSYDESAWARALAGHLGTPHTVIEANDRALRQALATVTASIAEPVADPAALPTYLLARAARESVAVVLSGEGADELFGGYPTYAGHRLAPWFQALPPVVRRGLRAAIRFLPASSGKVPLEYLLKRFVDVADRDWLTRHVAWFGTSLSRESGHAWRRADLAPVARLGDVDDPVRAAMLFDYLTYLRDGLLTKIDRTTMLCSVEARAPYLDGQLADFAFRLPTYLRVRGLTTKWLLKEVARDWLPRRIVRRRKRGMSIPLAHWLNDGLRTEVDRLLSPQRLRRAGLLPHARVRQLLAEHRSGRVNHGRALWPLIVLELWRERWLGD
jgi:asparagine synthase (glutamine-hydrolysing)